MNRKSDFGGLVIEGIETKIETKINLPSLHSVLIPRSL